MALKMLFRGPSSRLENLIDKIQATKDCRSSDLYSTHTSSGYSPSMSDGTITPHSLHNNLQQYLGPQTVQRSSLGKQTGGSQRSTASEDESSSMTLRLDIGAAGAAANSYKSSEGGGGGGGGGGGEVQEVNGDLKVETMNTRIMSNERQTLANNTDQRNCGEKISDANGDGLIGLQANYVIGQHNPHTNHHGHYHHNHHHNHHHHHPHPHPHGGHLHYHHLKRQARHLRHFGEHSLRIPLKLRKLGAEAIHDDLVGVGKVPSAPTDNGGEAIVDVLTLAGKSNAIANKTKINQSNNKNSNNNNNNSNNNSHDDNNGKKITSSSTSNHHHNTADGSYQCQFCDKSFPRLGYLKKHEQSHAEHLPFKCEYCARLFKHKRSRDRHTKLHTGDRRYRCPHCEAAFSRSDHLKIHMKTHDNQKPFQCTLCTRGYNTAAALTSHMQTHKRQASSNLSGDSPHHTLMSFSPRSTGSTSSAGSLQRRQKLYNETPIASTNISPNTSSNIHTNTNSNTNTNTNKINNNNSNATTTTTTNHPILSNRNENSIKQSKRICQQRSNESIIPMNNLIFGPGQVALNATEITATQYNFEQLNVHQQDFHVKELQINNGNNHNKNKNKNNNNNNNNNMDINKDIYRDRDNKNAMNDKNSPSIAETEKEKMTLTIDCEYCNMKCINRTALWQHIRVTHLDRLNSPQAYFEHFNRLTATGLFSPRILNSMPLDHQHVSLNKNVDSMKDKETEEVDEGEEEEVEEEEDVKRIKASSVNGHNHNHEKTSSIHNPVDGKLTTDTNVICNTKENTTINTNDEDTNNNDKPTDLSRNGRYQNIKTSPLINTNIGVDNGGIFPNNMSISSSPRSNNQTPTNTNGNRNTFDKPDIFFCSYCNAGFPHLESFRKHFRTHMDQNSQFVCHHCGLIASEQNEYERHVISHYLITNTEYNCPAKCTKFFSKSEELQKHLMDQHSLILFKCTICSEICDNKVALQVHFACSHSLETKYFRCSACMDVFRTEDDFNGHVRSRHQHQHQNQPTTSNVSATENLSGLQQLPLILPVTTGTSTTSTPHQQHPLQCLFCRSVCSSDLEMQFHLATHARQYRCPSCSETFHVEYLLERHMQTQHDNHNHLAATAITEESIGSFSSMVSTQATNLPAQTTTPITPSTAPINALYMNALLGKSSLLSQQQSLSGNNQQQQHHPYQNLTHQQHPNLAAHVPVLPSYQQNPGNNNSNVSGVSNTSINGNVNGHAKGTSSFLDYNIANMALAKGLLHTAQAAASTIASKFYNPLQIDTNVAAMKQHSALMYGLSQRYFDTANRAVFDSVYNKTNQQQQQQSLAEKNSFQFISPKGPLGAQGVTSISNTTTTNITTTSGSAANTATATTTTSANLFTASSVTEQLLLPTAPASTATSGSIVAASSSSNSGSSGAYSCGVCERCDFRTESEMHSHRKIVHNLKTGVSLRCAYCSGNFKSRNELEHHMKICHNSTGKHKCLICDEIFPSPAVLAEHKLQHSKVGQSGKCSHCLKILSNSNDFKLHLPIHNTDGQLPVQCICCRQTLHSEFEISLHAKFHVKNENSPENVCALCLEPITGTETKVCEKCCRKHNLGLSTTNISLNNSGNNHTNNKITNHDKNLHISSGKNNSGSQDNINNIQNYKNLYQNSLKYKAKTTGDNNGSSATSLPSIGTEIKCNLCKMQFSQRQKLQEHLIEHTFAGCEERGFNCYICSAVFTVPAGLLLHMLEHGANARPYDCNLCPEKFYFRAELDHHLIDHDLRLKVDQKVMRTTTKTNVKREQQMPQDSNAGIFSAKLPVMGEITSPLSGGIQQQQHTSLAGLIKQEIPESVSENRSATTMGADRESEVETGVSHEDEEYIEVEQLNEIPSNSSAPNTQSQSEFTVSNVNNPDPFKSSKSSQPRKSSSSSP